MRLWKDTLSTSKPTWPTLFLQPFKERQFRAFNLLKQIWCFVQNFFMGKPRPFIPSQKYIVSMVQRLPVNQIMVALPGTEKNTIIKKWPNTNTI